jgi:flagellar basal-body rod modification protein FlgD
MPITNTIGVDNNTAAYQPAPLLQQNLGKEDFLKLLATQLSFQNPLEPVADTEFIAQLAEFSALEQMQNANANLEAIALLTGSLNNALATTLVGKEVKINGDAIHFSGSGQVPITYTLAGDANAKVTVKIYDANDRLVRGIAVGSQPAGENEISWDGRDESGQKLPEGDYYYKVEAVDEAGKPVTVTTFTVGRISGIKFIGGTAMITINGRQASLAEIVEVME